MKNYIPPYQITDEILMHVSSISDKIGQITQRNGLEAKPHLRKNNKIRSIHSSLHIEANSLSLNEVKDVIKFLGENPGAYPWDEAKKYFSKSLMLISSEYTLQI